MSNSDAVRKYQTNRGRIVLRPTTEQTAQIKKAAAQAGESVQRYVLTAVEKRMNEDATDE